MHHNQTQDFTRDQAQAIATQNQNRRMTFSSQQQLRSSMNALLDDEDIDWNGVYKRSGTFKKDIPVLDGDSSLYKFIVDEEAELEMGVQAASENEITVMLANLKLHRPTQSMTEGQSKRLLKDYLEDLGEYPAKLIEKACKDYRTDGSKSFFPTSGQLIDLMKDEYYTRKRRLDRAKKVIEVSSKKVK